MMNHSLGLLVGAVVSREDFAGALLRDAPKLFDSNRPAPRLSYAVRPQSLMSAALVDLAEEAFGSFEVLDAVAQALSKERGARTWVVSCSSGDSLWVKAFDAKGERWSCTNTELEEHPREAKKLLASLTQRFGAEAVEEKNMSGALPYWRLWAERSTQPERVLELFGSPLIDFAEGEWEQEAELEVPAPTASPAPKLPEPVQELVEGMMGELVRAIEERALRAMASARGRAKPATEAPLHEDFEREDPEAVKRLYAEGLRTGQLTSADVQAHLSPRFRASDLVLHLLELFEDAGITLVRSSPKKGATKKPTAKRKAAPKKVARRTGAAKR